MDFLTQGIPVLCEKPLSESPSEAREMVTQAAKSGVALAVNHTRRLFPAYRKIKEIIEQGVLGKLISIEYVDGWPFHWPTTSGFYFKKASPAGVLLDKGVHGLDAICWWLGGKPEVIAAQNDSFGGMEGAAYVKLRHQGCIVEVKLSWLAKLKSTYTIVGELARLEGGIEEWDVITMTHRSGKKSQIKLPGKETAYNDFGHKMLDNFIEVVSKEAAPLVPGHEVLPSIELIDECYRVITRFPMPWMESAEVGHGK
jgi:predicted dehydrogenase